MMGKVRNGYWAAKGRGARLVLRRYRWSRPTIQEQALVDALRARVAALSLPSVDASDSSAEQEWIENCHQLRYLLLTEDVRGFLKWPVVQHTMFVVDAPYVHRELAFLKSLPDWKRRWKPALRESKAGGPARYVGRPTSSANLIHHTYQVAQFEAIAGVQVNQLQTVIEFGGGYGSMCRLMQALGFEGHYWIIDLEPFSSLQRCYLELVSAYGDQPARRRPKLHFTSNFKEVALPPSAPSLFFASWSLSETSVSVRRSVESLVDTCSYWYVAYQDTFGEVDNVAYFADLVDRQSGKTCINDSLPYQEGSHQLVAVPLLPSE